MGAEGTEGKVQTPTSSTGGGQDPGGIPGTGGTEAGGTLEAGDVQKQLSALQQELADQKAQGERDRRSMQAKIDKDIAREQKQRETERTALQGYVRTQLEQAGAEPEELAAFEQDYDRFTEGLSDKEMAGRYKEMVATTAEERGIREAQQEIVSGIAEEFEVEIPLDHPDLNKDDPPSLQRSALKLAKQLLVAKAKQGDQDALALAGKKGELSSLGGGPGGAANPIANITDPTELLKMGFKKEKGKK